MEKLSNVVSEYTYFEGGSKESKFKGKGDSGNKHWEEFK